MKTAMEARTRPLLAFGFMMMAIFSFTLMAVAGRELAGRHDTFEIMMYRSFVGLAIVLAVGGLAGTLGQITTRSLGLHAVRNLFHFTGQNLWFFAVGLIPMAQLFALEFTTPLWVALFAPLILGERWRLTRGLAALLGFAGILIVARPDSIVIGPGQMAAVMCAFGFAGAMLATKMLSRTETVTCILFWLVSLQAAFGIVTAGIDGQIRLPDAESVPLLVIVGFTGLFSHFCITSALSVAPASIVSPMEFLRLPLFAVTGFLLYGEPVEVAVFVGAAVVLAANLMNIRAERRRTAAAA